MKGITACTLDCPDACSLLCYEDGRGVFHLRGNPDHPVTSGFTCGKIKNFHERLRSPDRLTTPRLREGEKWRSVDWETALALCAGKIQALRREPASILHIHGEGAKGVLKQAGKLLFASLGASRVRGSLCDAAGYVASVQDFGSRDNHDIRDLLNAQRIVNWGKDLSRSSVHTAAMVKQARKHGTAVLSISPGGDGNAPFSDEWVRIRPGTDRFLAAAVIRLLLQRGMMREEILSRTANWDRFRSLIAEKSVEELLGACDVEGKEFERVFAFYAGQESVATLIGAGVQRYRYGGENVRFINALALLSGNIGRSGGGSYFHLHSLRNVNLDWTKDPERKTRRAFHMPTIGLDILEAKDPPLRMIWVNGSNVINQAPDSREVARAFQSVEFKVVVDAFMTDTAERADLVLPCTLMLEQEDIVASYLHDYVHYVKPVLEPPKEARSDFWIFSELAKRLDPPVDFPDAETCLRASLESPHLEVSLEELREKSYVRALRPRIAYGGMRFDHKDGRYRFPESLHDEGPVSDEYPLRLLTLIRKDAIHSQILPEKQVPPAAWVAPENPFLKHLDLEREVFLASPLGRLRVTLKFLPGLHPASVLYRRGDWMKLGGGANQLIAAGLTDVGDGAPFYEQYVRLENG